MFRSGIVEFEITDHGLVVYPKIPIEKVAAKTDFQVRKRFGIKGLDDILGGGIPQVIWYCFLEIPGTGKTMFGMHFLKQGIDDVRMGFCGLREPVEQVKRQL